MLDDLASKTVGGMARTVVAVGGPSGCGKTQLIARLVPILKRRGLKVGTLKHAHARIDLDRPGKDSCRHLKAGAEVVAVVGPRQLLVMRPWEPPGTLDQVLKTLPAELDLILLEGFHKTAYPQIAVADRTGKLRHGPHLIAVVSDRPIRTSVRRFRSSQIVEIARLIEGEWMKQWEISFHRACQGSSSRGA